MPYIDVFVDDDQFDRIIIDEIDHALSTDKDVEMDPEMRRSMMMEELFLCQARDGSTVIPIHVYRRGDG